MVKRRISQLEIDEADHRLTIERQRQGELRLHARSAAQFVLAKAPASDLPGRHVPQRELIGYVTPGHADVIRIAVPPGAFDPVRRHLRHVRYRLAALPGPTSYGSVVSE